MTRLFVLTLLGLAACGDPEPIEATLTFDAVLGDVDAACGVDAALGTGGTTGQLADARVFVSSVELRNDEGTWVAVDLADDGQWQVDGVALLDFEDGTAGCADSGNADLNDTLTGMVPDGTYDAIRFDVGLPHALNHLDSATAPAPLNAQGMFWVWASGYKFLRVDYAVQTDPASRWNVHLGSAGCSSEGPTIAPDEACARPNRPTITVEGSDPLTTPIRVDLLELVGGADVAVNTAETPPGCMSNPLEADDCVPVFDALGLDFESGQCVDGCAGQTVFSFQE